MKTLRECKDEIASGIYPSPLYEKTNWFDLTDHQKASHVDQVALLYHAQNTTNTPIMNKKHGGKRKGSGRPKKEPTVTIRVPKSKVEEIKKMCEK